MADLVVPQGWSLSADKVLSLPCPKPLYATAREFLAGGSRPVAEPRLATTVILVRPGDEHASEAQAFMLHRSAQMAFAAGAAVFPGGRVDDRDREEIGWAGPSPQQWGARMGCDGETARAVIVAGVRELFEESSVLLAGDDSGRVVSGLDGPDWELEARRLEAGETSLAEILARRRLVLRSDLLGVRSRWVTPEFEPRRYDTFFLSALLPDGQAARSQTTEAVSARWITAGSALRAAALGEIVLLPPTVHSLQQLFECASAEQFVHEDVAIGRLVLTPVESPDGGIELRCQLPTR